LRLCGHKPSKISAVELAAVIRRRFPQAGADLEADLAACEEAAWGDAIHPRKALKLIQMLGMHYDKLRQAGKQTKNNPSQPKERAL
jgi:transposase